jgi:hypothetical protein
MFPSRGRAGRANRAVRWASALVLSGLVAACSSATTPTTPVETPNPAPGGDSSAVLVGAGDIGLCGSQAPVQTGNLIKTIAGTVFAAGDLAYLDGSAKDFQECYDPAWGAFKSRTRPVPGNHEYTTSGASAYYNYFGGAADGVTGQGYYAYTVGSWLVVALNSEIDVSAGSPQVAWLRSTLQAANSKCVAAIWHKPLYSSGAHGPNPYVRDLWQVLYENNAEIVINGHDHIYEHFSPQDPTGRPDPNRGIRQFTVGTGGAALTTTAGRSPNSLLVETNHYGVLKLTLSSGAYTFDFISVQSAAVLDHGTFACH